MAENLSMALAELLRKADAEPDVDTLREGVRVMTQALMELEVAQHLGAERYQRSPDRQGERNGYRDRNWDPRVGTLELRVARVPRKSTVHIGRPPSVKTRERLVAKIAEWLRTNRQGSVWEHQAQLTNALNGSTSTLACLISLRKLGGVRQRAQKIWSKTLRRRSQRGRRTTDWASLHTKPRFQLPQSHLTKAWV
jgi:hypothetical protein